jgi:phage terminase large subunit-like protein
MNSTIEQKKIELKRRFLQQLDYKQNPIRYFKPLDYQLPFHISRKKNKAIFGGNRSGKTENGAAYVIARCEEAKKQGKSLSIWCATWADVSIPVQQAKIRKFLPSNVLYAKFSEQRGFSNRLIIYADQITIRFKTYDQGRESFQGTDKDIVWHDEEAPEDIVKECKAMLIDRNGEPIRTMTPLNGITYTYDEIVLNEINDPEIEFWYWDNSLNTYINQGALDRIIGGYADKEREVRSKGTFMNLTTGNAYYAFSEENIINENEFRYFPNLPLEISCDFNVELMCWNIGQCYNDADYTFDFVELEGQANTDLLCQMLKNKYVNHKGGFIFYGDIAGNQRHPEASRTNWAIIREHFPNAAIYYQNIKNIKDRVDSTNGRLHNQFGEHYYVTKNCKRLIRDFRQVTWEMLLNKTKAGKLTHCSDGESYRLYFKYPLTGKPTTTITRLA